VTAPDLPRRRRSVALAAALLLSVPSLAACAAAATDEVYTPTEGVNDRDGMVDVLHALVVSDGKDGGRLIAGLVNNDQEEADGLAGVTVADGEAQVEVGSGDREIPAGGLLQLAGDDAAQVIVSGVKLGGYVRVTFEFENAESATLNVPVLAPGTDFTGVAVPGQVTPSETGAVGQDPHSEGE
jgi:hypothetical protein